MNRICQLSAVQALKFVPVEAGESAIRIMLDTGEGGTKPGRFALLFVVVMLMMLMMLMMMMMMMMICVFLISVRQYAQRRNTGQSGRCNGIIVRAEGRSVGA